MRIGNNPLGSYMFLIQKKLNYEKILKEKGFCAVLEEHEKYVRGLQEKLEKMERQKNGV